MHNSLDINENYYPNRAQNFTKRILETFFLLIALVFPWLYLVPNGSESFKKELFFIFFGLVWIFGFIYFLTSGKFEFRKTKLDLFLALSIIAVGLYYLYSNAWIHIPEPYQLYVMDFRTFTAFVLLYFISIQLFSIPNWKKVMDIFILSIVFLYIFAFIIAIYDRGFWGFIGIPYRFFYVAAYTGVLAFSLWRNFTKSSLKQYFYLGSALLFLSLSLYYSALANWIIWASGLLVLVLFEIQTELKKYSYLQENNQFGIQSGEQKMNMLNPKLIILVLAFFTSIAEILYSVIIKGSKINFGEYYSRQFLLSPFSLESVFYLIALLIIAFGAFFYLKEKDKKRGSISLCIASLVPLLCAQVIVHPETMSFRLLFWILLIYSGLSFMRKHPEDDYVVFFRKNSPAKLITAATGILSSGVILYLIFR